MRRSVITLMSAWVHSVPQWLIFWPVVAVWEFDMVLNGNPIAKGCWELPGCGLRWSKPGRQRCCNKALKNNKNVLLEIPLMLLIALHSTHGVVKAKRDVRPSHAKQGLEPSFVARSPLHRLPQTGKEVRSKTGDLNLFQVLNLRASTLFADADHVSQPDSILSQDFCLHILFFNSNSRSGSLFPGLLSFAPSPSQLPKTHIQNLGVRGQLPLSAKAWQL